jgi:hypothetical protein
MPPPWVWVKVVAVMETSIVSLVAMLRRVLLLPGLSSVTPKPT